MNKVNKIKSIIKEVIEDNFLLRHNELLAEIDAKKIMLMQEIVRKHNNHGKEVDPETNQSDIEHFNATMATEEIKVNLYPGDKGVDVIGDEDLSDFTTVDIPLDRLVPNEPLRDKVEDKDVIDSLTSAYSSNQDVTPILVRKIKGDKYQILDGHHRYIAAKSTNQPSLKAIIIPPSAITLVDDNGEPLMEDINPYEDITLTSPDVVVDIKNAIEFTLDILQNPEVIREEEGILQNSKDVKSFLPYFVNDVIETLGKGGDSDSDYDQSTAELVSSIDKTELASAIESRIKSEYSDKFLDCLRAVQKFAAQST
jgi:hypothetical protein